MFPRLSQSGINAINASINEHTAHLDVIPHTFAMYYYGVAEQARADGRWEFELSKLDTRSGNPVLVALKPEHFDA